MDGENGYGRAGDTPPEPPAGWPRIEDYWPDAPRRGPSPRPPVDHYEWPGAEPAGGRPVPARPPAAPVRVRRDGRSSRPWWKPVLGAALAVVVTSAGLVLTRTTGMTTGTDQDLAQEPSATVAEQPSTAPPQVGPVSVAPPPASSPVAGSAPPSSAPPSPPPAERSPEPTAPPFTAGTFELVDGTTELNVRLRALDAEVFRVSAPPDSGVTPRVTVTGSTVRLGVTRNGKTGRARVDLELNRDVTWALRLTGGVEQASLDLSGGRIRRVDLAGGAARLIMAVPAQPAALPIQMTGGLNTWRIETPGEPNVRVLLREGGGEVRLDDRQFSGVARGTTLVTGSGERAGRLDIDAVAGLGTLTVVRG